jgi:hypothetical protein
VLARGVGLSRPPKAQARATEVEGGNIRVEVLADSTTIERIWQLLHESYFPNYAVSAWQSTVLVSRSDRYSNDTQKDGA